MYLAYTGDAEDYTMPESYNGDDYYIMPMAFVFNNTLKKITVPDTVTAIGETAFAYCDALTEIVLHDNLSELGYGVFGDCESLKKVNIPSGISEIPMAAFLLCSSLEEIVIPENITKICDQAFYGCTGLKTVTLSEGLLSISSEAFFGCGLLGNLALPKTVNEIGGNAFVGCSSIKLICYGGTYAASYAEDNGIPYELIHNYTGIKIGRVPYKTVYPVGGTLDTTGLVICVSESGVPDYNIESGFTVGSYDFSTVGEKTITVSLGGYQANFKVTVSATQK